MLTSNEEIKCRLTNLHFSLTAGEICVREAIVAAHPLLNDPLPLPEIAPQEFLRQLGSWGNLLNLYKTQSALSGKHQLSRYNPEIGYLVCTPEEFWSESVDNRDVGRPYDFDRPFFEQFFEVARKSMLVPLAATNCEGSDYINGAVGVKDSYLCFGIFNSRNCMYSYMVHDCSDCYDCIDILQCELCYDCHMLRNCYDCRFSQICSNCSQCLFCEDCIGCKNCIFSFGLRHQQYMIRNQQVTREEYEQFVISLGLQSRKAIVAAKNQFHDELKAAGYTASTVVNAEDSSGHFLTNVKDVAHSYYTHNAHECGYMMLSQNCRQFWRGISEGGELGYESMAHGKTYCTYHCYMDVGGSFNLYSLALANGCSHCFGCVGLNRKSYCILNRQYTKDEYFDLAPRIIEAMKARNEWGRFFPASESPHYYQDALCSDWLEPIPLAVAMQRGYRVRAEEGRPRSSPSTTIAIPDSIADTPADICENTFVCPITGGPFRFQKPEFDFHARHGIPLPNNHWANRLRSRIAEVFLIPAA